MSLHRYAARRDGNEPELIQLAQRVGWRLWQITKPCDWIGLRRGVWHAIEVKEPGCEGHADEYTFDQRKFMAEVAACGGRVLVWRTKEDVMRDSNARASA